MTDLSVIVNRWCSWKYRVTILMLKGWTNSAKSTCPSDSVFWTDGYHTMHYRASYLAALPFDKFYKLVYGNDLSAIC